MGLRVEDVTDPWNKRWFAQGESGARPSLSLRVALSRRSEKLGSGTRRVRLSSVTLRETVLGHAPRRAIYHFFVDAEKTPRTTNGESTHIS